MGLVENPGIRCRAICPYVCPMELVLCIGYAKKDENRIPCSGSLEIKAQGSVSVSCCHEPKCDNKLDSGLQQTMESAQTKK